jgi:S-adenosylmethionine:tRNA ribosyltransferase-isomerase
MHSFWLEKVRQKGVKIVYVTLHVGIGTFRPVKCENIEEHKMHFEEYEIDEATASVINETKNAGGRIISVGTTSTRTLESASDPDGKVTAGHGNTDIFIYPPYQFGVIDGLITNFHLPESTLIMLVSAFAGRENTLRAYQHAIKEEYRFYSFGDACLFI